MSDSTNSGGGIGICGLLFVAFVVLKLCHVINWSWWWVTAPLWGGAIVALGIVLVLLVVLMIFQK